MSIFTEQIFNSYESFREIGLYRQRIKHGDILPIIQKKSDGDFYVSVIGKSYEQREIFLIKAGFGTKKILLWSQMHGNEPTATMSLFDILNFLEDPGKFSEERDNILNNCSMYFIPMLNPDGAERFIRRNAQGIDINRDALRTEAPESKLLMGLRDEIEPEFGFNLHDQDIWYAAGDTGKPASISFLAPAYNQEKDIDYKRMRSMQLIVSMNRELNQFIPGQTARYNDDFMPTAFGDNIQKSGTSTILIESGGQFYDPEKQYVRKLNTVSLLHALKVISDDSYKQEDAGKYETIPYNKKNVFFDYLLRNCRVKGRFGEYIADVGIRSIQGIKANTYEISDIGDLSKYFGYSEINMNGRFIDPIDLQSEPSQLIGYFS